MSTPFAVALFGLVFALVVLFAGDAAGFKGAVPLAFVVGGAMIFGGLATGLMRSISRGSGPK